MFASFESEFLEWARAGYTDAALYIVGVLVVIFVVMKMTTRSKS